MIYFYVNIIYFLFVIEIILATIIFVFELSTLYIWDSIPIMRRTINVFTSLIFIYSMIVCATCKQVAPEKVGNLGFNSLTYQKAESVPVYKTKQKPAAEDIKFSASTFFEKNTIR